MNKFIMVGFLNIGIILTSQAVVGAEDWEGVRGVYQTFLGRSPTQAEEIFWQQRTKLTPEVQIVQDFLKAVPGQGEDKESHFERLWASIVKADCQSWEQAQIADLTLILMRKKQAALDLFNSNFEKRIVSLLREDASYIDLVALSADESQCIRLIQEVRTLEDLERAQAHAQSFINKTYKTICSMQKP